MSELKESNGIQYRLIPSEGDAKSCYCLLLHGFLESSGMWNNLLSKLSGKCGYILPDLPGHGMSKMIDKPPMLKYVAQELESLIVESSRPVLLVGHSLGGYVALEMAHQYPDKIGGIFLFHSTAYPDSATRKKSRNQGKRIVNKRKESYVKTALEGLFLDNQRDVLDKEINSLVESASKMDEQTIAWYLDAMKNRPPHLELLSKRSFSLFYFEGINDPILSEEMLRQEIDFLNPEQVGWTSKSGHMSHLESPEEAASAINRALEKFH